MFDADEDVRDWATFGLGTLGTVDTPEIRDAFAKRLDDDSSDVVDEALAGLAQRRDKRALPFLLERLRQPDVDDLTALQLRFLS